MCCDNYITNDLVQELIKIPKCVKSSNLLQVIKNFFFFSVENNITFSLFTKSFHKNLRNAKFLTWHSQLFWGLHNFFHLSSDGVLDKASFFFQLSIFHLKTKCKRTKLHILY